MQSLAPTTWIIGAIVAEAVFAILGLALLRRYRWSKRRMVFVSAAPIPFLILLLCAFVFVSAATSSKESCGVDACGMAMGAAMMLAVAAMILFLIGAVIGQVASYLIARPNEEDVGNIFE